MNEPTRVLIVDDSPIVRGLLRSGLEAERGLQVVGMMSDGEAAVAAVPRLRPDVITMDIIMPRMDGYEAVKRIMRNHPTPILVVTDLEPNAVLFKMLAAGAVDVARKPLGRGQELKALAERVRMLGSVDIQAHLRTPVTERLSRWDPADGTTGNLTLPATSVLRHTNFPVVVLLASAGGPKALTRLMRDLPPNLKAAVLIVQHIPSGYAPGLAEWLAESTHHRVQVAQAGDVMRPGHFFVAPDDYHLTVGDENTLYLSEQPPVNGVRPAGDITLQTAAEQCGNRVIAVVLTGMGQDGAEGVKHVKQHGGRVLVQNEATSLIYSMPRAALPHADTERALKDIGNWILRRVRDLKWTPPT